MISKTIMSVGLSVVVMLSSVIMLAVITGCDSGDSSPDPITPTPAPVPTPPSHTHNWQGQSSVSFPFPGCPGLPQVCTWQACTICGATQNFSCTP